MGRVQKAQIQVKFAYVFRYTIYNNNRRQDKPYLVTVNLLYRATEIS